MPIPEPHDTGEHLFLAKIDAERGSEHATASGAKDAATGMRAKRKAAPPSGYRRARRGSRAKLDAAVAKEGDAAVFRLIAEGQTMQEIGESFGIDRDTVYVWIKEGGSDRESAWKIAKHQSADALVEQAGKILDEGHHLTNTAQAAMTRARAEDRKWLAGCRSREEYGDASGPAINVALQVGNLHLDALRRVGAVQVDTSTTPTLGSGEVIEADVEFDDDGDRAQGEVPAAEVTTGP